MNTLLFEDKVRGEIYVVGQSLREHLRAEAYPACLFTAITRQNDVFLLPVKLPAYDGKTNSWNESALAAVQLAVSKWVRIASNMSAGMYDVDEALGDLGAPVWPELSFRDILKLCFKDRLIESLDHPVLRSLRGEI